MKDNVWIRGCYSGLKTFYEKKIVTDGTRISVITNVNTMWFRMISNIVYVMKLMKLHGPKCKPFMLIWL